MNDEKAQTGWSCTLLIKPGQGATGTGSSKPLARGDAKRRLHEAFGTRTAMRGGESFAPIYSPRVKDSKPPTIDEIAKKQGWDDSSLLLLARQFISDNSLTTEFTEFLEDEADNDTPDEANDEDESEPRCYCGHFRAEHSSAGGCAGCDNGGKDEATIDHEFVIAPTDE